MAFRSKGLKVKCHLFKISLETSGQLLPMTNITRHPMSVSRTMREEKQGHRGSVVWLTGLSGSGKSTLAQASELHLHRLGYRTVVLDGDNIRHGLCSDLGFSASDRQENIRRIGEVAKLFLEAGVIVLTAFISPFRQDRQWVRTLFNAEDFIEVYCNTSLAVCEQRDIKQLYQKARQGLVLDFTGISSPYEAPLAPELTLDTAKLSVEECASSLLATLRARHVID